MGGLPAVFAVIFLAGCSQQQNANWSLVIACRKISLGTSKPQAHRFAVQIWRFFLYPVDGLSPGGTCENRWKMEDYVRNRNTFDARMIFLLVFLFAPIALSMGAAGCGSPKPAAVQQPEQGPKRYALTGRVVSVDKAKQQVVVDGADIPGFMMAMTMGYDVKNANQLDPLSPEDQIKADVVVNGSDVYLENIQVVKKADQGKTPPAGGAQPSTAKPEKQ